MESSSTTGSTKKGRPKGRKGILLEHFIARKKGKPVKFEVLVSCVVRKIIKMIGKPDSDVAQIRPHFARVFELIESDREEIQRLSQNWFNTLARVAENKNRQYNSKEIKSLLAYHPIFSEIFKVFIDEIVECLGEIKIKLLNLERWPELDGDDMFKEVMSLV
jgi:hypothetical protein